MTWRFRSHASRGGAVKSELTLYSVNHSYSDVKSQPHSFPVIFASFTIASGTLYSDVAALTACDRPSGQSATDQGLKDVDLYVYINYPTPGRR